MDVLHLAIALGPLSAYALLLGGVNLSTRPRVTTGARDMAALGIGIGGLMVAGPLELFLPEAPTRQFGAYVWLLVIALYILLVILIALLMRPRLVIYNVQVEQLRAILADIVPRLDANARWAGECLVIPQLGVQLHVESTPATRNAELIAAGPLQSFAGWRRLEQALQASLRDVRVPRNPYGFVLVLSGLAISLIVTTTVVGHPQEVAQALWEMLRK